MPAVDPGGVREADLADPAFGVGREVRVVGEDVGRGDVLLELHQQALLADVDVERVEGLHAVQVARVEERLAQGRHPEVDEGVVQVGVAEAARGHRQLPAA